MPRSFTEEYLHFYLLFCVEQQLVLFINLFLNVSMSLLFFCLFVFKTGSCRVVQVELELTM